jgi:molecular chaperone Hsp33
VAPEASPDGLVRALSAEGSLSVRALVATAVVAEAAERHRTSPLATAALGRALMGAVLLGALGKGDETVDVRFRGDGPLGTVIATADAHGRVRGYVSRPGTVLPLRGGKLDVGGAIGAGNLSVVRFAPGWKEPYTGIVPIETGEVATDLAVYLRESEQTPAAVGLGVYLEADGSVGAAGGWLAAALPGAPERDLARLEANVQRMAAPSEMVRTGAGADGMVDVLLRGLAPYVLEREVPRFHCGCSEERVLRAVALLGHAALREHIDEGVPVEVRCEFCGEEYRVDALRARVLLLDA